MLSFAAARRMMVDGQVRTNDVTDSRIIAAMEALPRENFVHQSQAALAYLDRDLPVAGGNHGEGARCLLKPMVLAKLIHAADIGAPDRVLDVACATGYSTAVLAQLADSVVALEEDGELASLAERNVRALGLQNVTVRKGPLMAGAPADGPFDVIVINGAVEQFPQTIGAQLKDGGRLVCILRQGPAAKAMLYISDRGDLSGRVIFDAAAPVLPGFGAPAIFAF
jgi:protein-L-isoaspartate(D-aspartate) O-methyltransferase